MNGYDHITDFTIDWATYTPPRAMQEVITAVNQLSLAQITASLPHSEWRENSSVRFEYRLYTDCSPETLEHVHILFGGFAEPAGSIGLGVKGVLADSLMRHSARKNSPRSALLVIGGLFEFSREERAAWRSGESKPLVTIASSVTDMIHTMFPLIQSVSVAGSSLGGVLSPLVAREIVQRKIATVERVCSAEPSCYFEPITSVQLFRRFARSSAYRNQQIEASQIVPYIEAKKAPQTVLGRAYYRLQLYRPLFARLLSMRLVIQDLAKQADFSESKTDKSDLCTAYLYLALNGVPLELLRAQNSIVCNAGAFYELVGHVKQIAEPGKALVTVVSGSQADHGIEEQRSLSTPFLVMPALLH